MFFIFKELKCKVFINLYRKALYLGISCAAIQLIQAIKTRISIFIWNYRGTFSINRFYYAFPRPKYPKTFYITMNYGSIFYPHYIAYTLKLKVTPCYKLLLILLFQQIASFPKDAFICFLVFCTLHFRIPYNTSKDKHPAVCVKSDILFPKTCWFPTINGGGYGANPEYGYECAVSLRAHVHGCALP